MAFGTFLALCLFCAGSALTLVTTDNVWAKDHSWLIPVLWTSTCVFAALALASARWFRSLFHSHETAGEETVQQGTRGHNSPAGAIGSMGAVGEGANVIVGGNQTIFHPVPFPPIQNRPQLCFKQWAPIPPEIIPTLRNGQSGFEIANDGGAAHEVLAEDVEVEKGVIAKSRTVNRIEANGGAYAYVWLDGFGSSPNPAKWDLTGAMRRAASTRGTIDYSVAVSMVYRDSDHHWFRSFARLAFIPSQNRLEFGPTRHSQRVKCEFLEGFFHWGPFSGQSGLPTGQWDVARSDFYITLAIRFINDGAADISITALTLTIAHADASIALTSEKIVLPQPHCIKRRTSHHRGPTGITSSATENKHDISLPLTLQPDRPCEGLVQFLFRNREVKEGDDFQDQGRFVLEAIDTRDNVHRFVRPAGVWPKDGEIVPYAAL